MKKLLYALLFPIFSMAQQEKVNFTHKLVYEANHYGKYYPVVTLYYSPDVNIIEIEDFKILFKDQYISFLNPDLERTIENIYFFENRISSFALLKTDQKDIINGISCNYYDMYTSSYEQSSKSKMKMCISTNDSANILGILPVVNKKVKGLMVKVESDDGSGLRYELKTVNKTNAYVYVDRNEISAKIKEKEKGTGTESFEVEIARKTYDSEYKILKTDSTTLAVDRLENNSPYWKGLPVYCKGLDQKVSVFKNSIIKEHVRNYTGQICDLYLSKLDEYSVDVKSTIDHIRYEENYFRNTVFDKTDRKILDIFLNGLD